MTHSLLNIFANTLTNVVDTPMERFVEFIPMFGHTGEEMANIVLSFLEKNDIAINDCRGQSYDNAANMVNIMEFKPSYGKDVHMQIMYHVQLTHLIW